MVPPLDGTILVCGCIDTGQIIPQNLSLLVGLWQKIRVSCILTVKL